MSKYPYYVAQARRFWMKGERWFTYAQGVSSRRSDVIAWCDKLLPGRGYQHYRKRGIFRIVQCDIVVKEES